MISIDILKSTISSLNEDREATFAEFIAKLFLNKFIEIYLGDFYEEINTEQISNQYIAVFSGKVIGAYKECLIIDTMYIDANSKKYRLGHILFINERSIRALSEVDGNSLLWDMVLKSKDALKIKNEHPVLKDVNNPSLKGGACKRRN